MNRNVINGTLIVLFSLATIISGLTWINNIYIAKEWYSDVSKGEVYKIVTTEAEKKEATDQNIKAKIYQGPIPSSSIAKIWATVDISTVSTFVPFLGFLLIAIALIRIVFWGVVVPKSISEHFPFFHDYDRKMIILGLAGTFWGIIMIGYYPPGKIDMSNLMLCLHTALYSTLVAVLWIFFIAMPGKQVMAWWIQKSIGLRVGLEQDMTAVFEEFGAASMEAGGRLRQCSDEIKAVKEQMSKTKKGFQEVLEVLNLFKEKTGLDLLESFGKIYQRAAVAMEKISGAVESQGKFQKQVVEQQQKLLQQNQEVLKQYQEELLKQATQRDEAEKRERAMAQRNSALVSQLDQVRAGLKDALKAFEGR